MGMNSHPLFISNITVMKHTQLTSNIQGAIELFCFVPNYVELGNKNILAKKVGRITIKVGRDELVLTQNQFRTFLNAGIRMATGELETTILELGETPSLSFSVNEFHKLERIDKMTFELGCLNHLIDDEGNCFDKHEIEALTKIRDNLEWLISGDDSPSPSFFLSTRTDLTSARNGTHTTRLGSNSRVHKRATRSQEGTTKSSRTCCNNAKQDRLNSIQSLARRLQDNVGLHRSCHVGITGDLSPSLLLSSCIKRAGVGGDRVW